MASAPAAGASEGRRLQGWTYDFWSRLEPEDAAALAKLGRACAFRRGQALVHERQVVDRVLLLRSGRVKITVATPAGRELILAFRGPGELVGELAALDGRPRSATVAALEPVDALAVPHEQFHRFLERRPRASLVLLAMLARRLRDADGKRLESAAASSLERVACRILELCERFGEPDGDAVEITFALTQEELAGWAGASLESVGRVLRQMRDLGWIETRRRRVRVLDVEALRRTAG